eukprot:364946-Chlamydomonas_euryale.AAC.8
MQAGDLLKGCRSQSRKRQGGADTTIQAGSVGRRKSKDRCGRVRHGAGVLLPHAWPGVTSAHRSAGAVGMAFGV